MSPFKRGSRTFILWRPAVRERLQDIHSVKACLEEKKQIHMPKKAASRKGLKEEEEEEEIRRGKGVEK